MAAKHTREELNNCSKQELVTMILLMQEQLEALNRNVESLLEQIHIANNARFESLRCLTPSNNYKLTRKYGCIIIPRKL